MNTLDIITKETGNVYTRKASTHGGEFAGPCPWCGGEDRFSIHPAIDHYVCRMCKKAGDKIQFVKEFLKKDYIETCKFLNVQPKIKFSSLDASKEEPGQNDIVWKPQEIKFPNKKWLLRAEKFAFHCHKLLFQKYPAIIRWLNDRGLTNETIKQARLGYNNSSMNFDPESWGLFSEQAIWLPIGLIIPQFYDGKLIRLRIRQMDITAKSRYIVVRGSSSGFFDYKKHTNNILSHKTNKPWIITESELDGWLLYQNSNDSLRVYSAGSSSAKPDLETHKYLKDNPGLINLDNDEAGHKGMVWWIENYPDCNPYYSLISKDPGEDFKEGIDIFKWLNSGLKTFKIINKNIDIRKTSQGTDSDHGTDSNTDFKKKIIDRYKKEKYLKEKKKENFPDFSENYEGEAPQILKDSKLCLHTQYCVSLKNNVCLVDKSKPIETLFCPKNKWYVWKEGGVLEVILGPGMKNR